MIVSRLVKAENHISFRRKERNRIDKFRKLQSAQANPLCQIKETKDRPVIFPCVGEQDAFLKRGRVASDLRVGDCPVRLVEDGMHVVIQQNMVSVGPDHFPAGVIEFPETDGIRVEDIGYLRPAAENQFGFVGQDGQGVDRIKDHFGLLSASQIKHGNEVVSAHVGHAEVPVGRHIEERILVGTDYLRQIPQIQRRSHGPAQIAQVQSAVESNPPDSSAVQAAHQTEKPTGQSSDLFSGLYLVDPNGIRGIGVRRWVCRIDILINNLKILPVHLRDRIPGRTDSGIVKSRILSLCAVIRNRPIQNQLWIPDRGLDGIGLLGFLLGNRLRLRIGLFPGVFAPGGLFGFRIRIQRRLLIPRRTCPRATGKQGGNYSQQADPDGQCAEVSHVLASRMF